MLVVEDLPQVRHIAVQMFEDLGHRVFQAYNGATALELLRAHPEIRVLFTDVRMPGMDGLGLADAAQRMRPHLKVVLTSGYVAVKDLP